MNSNQLTDFSRVVYIFHWHSHGFPSTNSTDFASPWWKIDGIAFRIKNNVDYLLIIMMPTLSPYPLSPFISFRFHCYLLAVIVSLKLFVTHKQLQTTKIEVLRSANNRKSSIANFSLRESTNSIVRNVMKWIFRRRRRKKVKRTVSERTNNMPAMGVESHVFSNEHFNTKPMPVHNQQCSTAEKKQWGSRVWDRQMKWEIMKKKINVKIMSNNGVSLKLHLEMNTLVIILCAALLRLSYSPIYTVSEWLLLYWSLIAPKYSSYFYVLPPCQQWIGNNRIITQKLLDALPSHFFYSFLLAT